MPITAQPRHLLSRYDVTVVGAGPAGLAAAVAARDQGAERILMVDRDPEPGGILLQCIHSGFGLHEFKQDVTGPEYAHLALERVVERDVDVLTNTYVTDVSRELRVKLMSPDAGISTVDTGSLVIATGARERTRAAIKIPGERPAGVMTAGLAQKMVNLHGYLPGRRAVILGSGDIGLIMARRLTLEGVEVLGVFELLPFASGLGRNVVQCLHDFDIPLHLSTTVVDIHGHQRTDGVTVAPVDDDLQPQLDRSWDIDCDTLLLSIGLIPDAELARQLQLSLDPRTGGPVVSSTMETSLPGVFAAGNNLHVNDLADWVSQEASAAGAAAGDVALGRHRARQDVTVTPGRNVAYVVPHTLSTERSQTVSFRVKQPIYGDTKLHLGDAHQRKVRAVVPPEMVTMKVSPKLLDGFAGDTLRVDAIPVEEEEES